MHEIVASQVDSRCGLLREGGGRGVVLLLLAHCNCQLSFRFGGCQTSCQIKNAQLEWQQQQAAGTVGGVKILMGKKKKKEK